MVTKEQALTAQRFHFTGRHECSRIIGPKGGVTERITVVRRNGQTQVWKRSPERFRVPVKYGLYEYGEITEVHAHLWHVDEECPLRKVDLEST